MALTNVQLQRNFRKRRTAAGYRRVHVWLHKDLVDKLDALSEKRAISAGAITSEAIIRYVESCTRSEVDQVISPPMLPGLLAQSPP